MLTALLDVRVHDACVRRGDVRPTEASPPRVG